MVFPPFSPLPLSDIQQGFSIHSKITPATWDEKLGVLNRRACRLFPFPFFPDATEKNVSWGKPQQLGVQRQLAPAGLFFSFCPVNTYTGSRRESMQMGRPQTSPPTPPLLFFLPRGKNNMTSTDTPNRGGLFLLPGGGYRGRFFFSLSINLQFSVLKGTSTGGPCQSPAPPVFPFVPTSLNVSTKCYGVRHRFHLPWRPGHDVTFLISAKGIPITTTDL